jgi:hypothetical protein
VQEQVARIEARADVPIERHVHRRQRRALRQPVVDPRDDHERAVVQQQARLKRLEE